MCSFRVEAEENRFKYMLIHGSVLLNHTNIQKSTACAVLLFSLIAHFLYFLKCPIIKQDDYFAYFSLIYNRLGWGV